ncbi:MAG: GNAT family protein [Schumannella sp.]|nr:GNAT family N-acetyltransferase [Microbacteriaceae bacterium]
MSAVRPEPAILTGRFVRLEPLEPAHLPGLFAALHHPAVFAGGFGGGPAGMPRDREAFDAWALRYGVGPDAIRFVVRVSAGPHAGEIVGASTLGDLDEEREHAHIGWTGYDPRVWGTQVNPETKLLMLGLAFSRGYGRVKLQADERNERSRRAIERVGASFEGVVRRDLRRADGSWRDTALYSILVDEWPAVRAGLERRLAEWGDRPVLYRTPSE